MFWTEDRMGYPHGCYLHKWWESTLKWPQSFASISSATQNSCLMKFILRVYNYCTWQGIVKYTVNHAPAVSPYGLRASSCSWSIGWDFLRSMLSDSFNIRLLPASAATSWQFATLYHGLQETIPALVICALSHAAAGQCILLDWVR
jgi:hypothetical protein